MKGKIESVVVELNIEQRPDGVTAFYIMQTPIALWNALPQRAKSLDADHLFAHSMKKFTLTVRRRRYEFTFYRSERRSW
jgi:hypothetical protein